MFKVERNQLYLDFEQGGIKLVDVESKAKSLFIKNIINVEDEQENEDPVLLHHPKIQSLGRNTKEWIQLALRVKENSALVSVKAIYRFFVDEKKIRPRVENVFPNINWEIIWENLSYSFIPSDCKSQMFLLYNDLIISKDKLVKYNIGRLTSNVCDYCPRTESNRHILKECIRTKTIREWLTNVLKERLHITIADAEDILSCKINNNNKRQKAALWITMVTYTYVTNSYPNCSLFILKKNIRESRWNNRRYFAHCFGKWLNIE